MTLDVTTAAACSDPVPVVSAIAALLGSLPDPDLDPEGQRAWLTAKADLLDRVADAAATPDLAARAHACATAARHALAAAPAARVVDTRLSNPLNRNDFGGC